MRIRMQETSEDEIERRRKEAAKRATEEAKLRNEKEAAALAKELGGRKGPEPTRFGDWEKKGIASDF